MASPPWRKPKPKEKASIKLTPESIAWAKESAKKAGRRYPNLVDNMAATRRQIAQATPPAGGDDRAGL
jgi:hypothetical protein